MVVDMSNDAEPSVESLFTNYWQQVRHELGLSPSKRKSLIRAEVIELLARNWGLIDGERMVRRLFDCLQCEGWESSPGKNWVWRDRHRKPAAGNASQEVLLEHRIIERGGVRWTRQMSTASGVDRVDGKRTRGNRRRAIDLVYDQDGGGYSFVELKVASDYPFYAVFEILGYGLAYLHKRRVTNLSNADGKAILKANKIDLVVLGAEQWYRDNPPGMAAETEEALRSLLKKLNNGLECLTDGVFRMRLACACYPLIDPGNALDAAQQAIAAIISLDTGIEIHHES